MNVNTKKYLLNLRIKIGDKRFSKSLSQWTFWYCNDVGVTSPSISLWHCWYIVNETHDDVNLRYQPDIRILRLDQSDVNVVMIWSHRDNGRYPAERNPPGSNTTSGSATIISCLYCGIWKIKAPDDFFFSCCCKNIYWERRTKMSPN